MTNQKTFKLTIFKGHDVKMTKTVTASNLKELREAKNGFWSESPYTTTKGCFGVWMGVKRIRNSK